MAYDEGLAVRIEEALINVADVTQKKMFGGLAFMVQSHMCVGVIDDKLMARVGPDLYEECLKKKHANKMDFTGKPLKGFVYVSPEGIYQDEDLQQWIDLSMRFIKTLPPKKQ